MTEAWLILPAYNEAEGIAANLDTLSVFLESYRGRESLRFTLLVVDDGSIDATAGEVERMIEPVARRGIDLKLVSFVRNFGHQAALIAGLVEAAPSADLAITLDADGEHPYAFIPELIDAWLRGAPLVHTIRRPHRQLGLVKRWTSSMYYSLLAGISGLRIRPGMADFKLWDGELLRQVSRFLPQCGSTRVFAAWLAPQAPTVVYDQHLVPGRSSRFSLRQNLSSGLNGIIRYTELPLRFSLIMGAFAAAVGIAQTGFVLWASLTNRVVPGWSSIMIIVAFFGAMQSLAIGILGEYLLRIQFRNGLPLFVNGKASTGPRRLGPRRQDEHDSAQS